jgi:hypothetical protein
MSRGGRFHFGMLLSRMGRSSNRTRCFRLPRLTVGPSLLTVAVLLIVPRLCWGADTVRQISDAGPMTEMRAMLLKYVARCALDPSQRLSADSAGSPAAPGSDRSAPATATTAAVPASGFPGLLGLAPEWLSGTCTGDCQERVSSCLIALVNRTGKHVDVSMISAAPSLLEHLAPNANDLRFPHQEGTFFGNVWTNQTFACQGTGVRQAPQSKRFCAVEPATCWATGAPLVDAGACADSCDMRCFAIGPDDQRCAAVSCRDPGGHVWRHPITVLLKNEIAAVNADSVSGMDIGEDALIPRARLARAQFNLVDLGSDATAVTRMWVGLRGNMAGTRLEVWLGTSQRLGATVLKAGPQPESRVEIPLVPRRNVAANGIVLRVRDGRRTGKITSIELR